MYKINLVEFPGPACSLRRLLAELEQKVEEEKQNQEEAIGFTWVRTWLLRQNGQMKPVTSVDCRDILQCVS